MIEISEEVSARNRHLLGPDEDHWVGQRISRGVHRAEGDNWDHYGPTVIVECMPLPLKARARLFRDGIDVIVPSVRRVPPNSLTPRAKTHNYLNLVMADLEAHARDPESWAVLLDHHGNLCEGLGSNIFVVQGGELLTPVRALRAAGGEPGDGDRACRGTRNRVPRGRHRPVRRLQRRGGVPDVHEPLHLPRAQRQRLEDRRRAACRARSPDA